jgi:hypothetical protein
MIGANQKSHACKYCTALRPHSSYTNIRQIADCKFRLLCLKIVELFDLIQLTFWITSAGITVRKSIKSGQTFFTFASYELEFKNIKVIQTYLQHLPCTNTDR